MDQIRSAQGNTYLMRLQGALCSRAIDWCVNVTIAPQEYDERLLISLTIDAASLRDFLDQFHDLELTVLPEQYIKNPTTT